MIRVRIIENRFATRTGRYCFPGATLGSCGGKFERQMVIVIIGGHRGCTYYRADRRAKNSGALIGYCGNDYECPDIETNGIHLRGDEPLLRYFGNQITLLLSFPGMRNYIITVPAILIIVSRMRDLGAREGILKK